MAMPATPIATNLDQTPDILFYRFPQFTLNPVLAVNSLPDAINLILGKAIRLGLRANIELGQNPLAQVGANATDIL